MGPGTVGHGVARFPVGPLPDRGTRGVPPGGLTEQQFPTKGAGLRTAVFVYVCECVIFLKIFGVFVCLQCGRWVPVLCQKLVPGYKAIFNVYMCFYV